MGFADVWNRTLVYFGIAEEDEEWDEEGYLANEELERTYAERPNVRRLAPRPRRDFDDLTGPDPEPDDRTAVIRPAPRPPGVESVPASVRVRLFRRVLPPLGPLDLSPVLAVIVLFAIQRGLDALFARLH